MKKTRTLLPILCLAILALAASSCKKKVYATAVAPAAPTASTVTEKNSDQVFGKVVGFNVKSVRLAQKNFKNYKPPTQGFTTDAHKAYLADPMKFTPLPDQRLPEGATAVVGSDVCVLYPNATLESKADLDNLPKGVPIPFGTIIPIKGDRVQDSTNDDRNSMFEYQDNWNWFYATSYNGQEGLVFGADLYGLDDTNEANRISARLYQTGGKYDAFYPVLGYHPLPASVTAALERDRLAIQAVGQDEYDLRGYRSDTMPDDMLALYDLHKPHYDTIPGGWRRKTPVFVTTDVAAHIQHLMFDRTLQFQEEAIFLPRLKNLVGGFIADLTKRQAEATDYAETMDKAIMYFQVAEALLNLAPERVSNESDNYGADPFLYKEQDRDAVLARYPEPVRLEIEKIYKAEDYSESPVFTFADGKKADEDYTQYKPRGHYTKNGALSAYFRAMMWFGRVHFLIAGAETEEAKTLTLKMEPIALLITDVAQNDGDLLKRWEALFNPITALIGVSDDLSIRDILPLWKDERVSEKEFGAWSNDRAKVLAFMEKAHRKLKSPAISGASVFDGPSEGADRKPPMGWRLFGQRFTYDSSVHHRVSPPRLMSRDMVRGLDVMKACGSKTADALLAGSDYQTMVGLESRLDEIESEFSKYDSAFWGQTYYNGVLFQVKAQAQFEPGAGFYFTEGKGWATKAMLSSHGTWSELRHDTLLYAKQSCAERAGDGDFYPTFRTKPIPEPIHYLEPNVPFWQGSALSVQKFLATLDEYDLLDEETAKAFSRLQEIYVKAAAIAETEAQNRQVSANDIQWIATIPSELIQLCLIHVEGGDIIDENQLRMAIVADVFTNFELKMILETAVGIPYRIYVPLNDTQGGKRIAVGYAFSYYEFNQPMNERMTDETWKEIVYAPNANLEKYQPFWMKDQTVARERVRK
jgi:Protein of unknown function (DUF3160)